MSFKEEILTLANQVQARKQFVCNEETTKHSLIVPFIQALGYDVFNPLEVRPEYSADFGKKKAEKVDYAILINDKPTIFIEAKDIKENLNNHDAQLSRYFNSTPEVKFAILTNGVKYKFFTDLKTNNIMDSQPFFELDINNLTDDVISILQKFTKELFDTESIIAVAQELTYMLNINSRIISLFENPTDDFIKLLIKDFNIRTTSSIIEKFRPLVKKSIKDALIDIISKGIFSKEIEAQEKIVLEESQKKQNKQKIIKKPSSENDKLPIILPEELDTFKIVKKVLIAYGKNVEEINCKKAGNNFIIFYKDIKMWFLKFNLHTHSKSLVIRLSVDKTRELCDEYPIEPYAKGVESKISIKSHLDIKGFKGLIVMCFEQAEKEIN